MPRKKALAAILLAVSLSGCAAHMDVQTRTFNHGQPLAFGNDPCNVTTIRQSDHYGLPGQRARVTEVYGCGPEFGPATGTIHEYGWGSYGQTRFFRGNVPGRRMQERNQFWNRELFGR